MMKRVLSFLFIAAQLWVPVAQGGASQEELRPDFTEASVLVMDSGRAFFTCAGHLAMRMRCSTLRLDRCFSYESEPFASLLFRFLSGNLKMGMFRVPTEGFLDPYRIDKRGVREYPLCLPADVKRELWLLLDEKAAEGIELKYDYIERGCAQSMLRCLMVAAGRCGKSFDFPRDRPYYHHTHRELFSRRIRDYPWYLCLLHLIVGTDLDRELVSVESAVIPEDAVDLLRAARIDGRPVIADAGEWLVPQGRPVEKTVVSPNRCAAVFFGLCVLAVFLAPRFRLARIGVEVLQAAMLTLQLFAGLLIAYMVFSPSVPGGGWNWLIVPLNPLPVLFWRWRSKWRVVYSLMLSVWIVGMLVSSHCLTYPAYLLLAAAFIPLILVRKR